MDNITIFDDNSQTETTLILNKDRNVIGVETYFATPRQVSAFFNKNEAFRAQPKLRKNATPIKTSIDHHEMEMDMHSLNSLDPHTIIRENQNPYRQPNSNIRFETTKAAPCGGPRQRPCR